MCHPTVLLSLLSSGLNSCIEYDSIGSYPRFLRLDFVSKLIDPNVVADIDSPVPEPSLPNVEGRWTPPTSDYLYCNHMRGLLSHLSHLAVSVRKFL